MSKILKAMLDIIFPPRCISCSDVVGAKADCCKKCEKSFELYSGKNCPMCDAEQRMCFCHKYSSLSGIFGVYVYNKHTQRMIINLKRNKDDRISHYIAKGMAQSIRACKDKFDYIVPVPMSDKSKSEGRFNQALLLAEKLGEILNISVKDDIVIKKNDTMPQHKLSKTQRKQNAEYGYEIVKSLPENAVVLLVDDVFTTGATINAISDKLIASGCKKVYALVAAVTTSEKDNKYEA